MISILLITPTDSTDRELPFIPCLLCQPTKLGELVTNKVRVGCAKQVETNFVPIF